MREVTYNGEVYVISRERGGTTELVSSKGDVVRVPSHEIQGLVITTVERGVVPGSACFSDRPRSFLAELRAYREQALLRRVKAKRVTSKTVKVPGEPRQKKISSGMSLMNQTMNSLPPEIAVLMAQQLSGLTTKKPSGKGKSNGK